MNPPDAPRAALNIAHLTVTLPDGRRLLEDATLTVPAGQFVLLAGVSGSGKSTLLKLIAGYDAGDGSPLTTSGRLDVLPSGSGDAARGRVGIVFQHLALLDELSAVDNVRFALDHASGGGGRAHTRAEAAEHLERLGVPTRSRLADLSGGERQRVAVARTLATDPSLLLFDEPTTGLDPRRARALADLIVRTHRQSGKTVLIVTHDFAPFLPYHPRLILLDADLAKLRQVSESELIEHFAGAARPERGAVAIAPRRRPSPAPAMRGTGEALVTVASSTVTPLRGWRRPRWKLRYLWHYLRIVLIGSTSLYVAAAGAMLGFVTVYFGFSQLPYAEVTVPLLTEEFLAAAGNASFRVFVPLLTSVLIAGKCGAALSADVGARRVAHQFEAMRSFGAGPGPYFHGNMVIALTLSAPLLAMIAYAAGVYASLVAFLNTSPQATIALFRRHYFATFWWPGKTVPYGSAWFIAKMAACGLLVAGLAYALGSRRKDSSVDVSRDVGLTIFWATLGVLAIHTVFAFVEF